MTQLTCDKLMNSHGSIETFRAKFTEQLKRKKAFLAHFSTTVNIPPVTHHPPEMVLLFCLQTRKKHRNPR